MQRRLSWQSRPLPPLVGGGLLVLVGVAVAIGGYVWRESLSKFLARATYVEGVVVAVERGRNSNSHFPVFSFRDAEGHSYEVRSEWSSEKLKKGDAVNVAYEPASPYGAVLPDAASPSGFPLFVIGFGIVFAAVGVSVGWQQYQYEKKRRLSSGAS